MRDLDLVPRLEAAASTVTEAAAVLRQTAPVRDWIDELEAGADAIKTDEAAYIANVHVDTIRKRAEGCGCHQTNRRLDGRRCLVV